MSFPFDFNLTASRSLMQPLARGDRRKPHTPDASRRRRSASQSSIPLSTPLTHITPLLQSITYLTASSPTLPLILLALPIPLFSTLLLLPFRPSLHAIRITFSTPHLPVLTALHVAHLLTTLLAIRLIGPLRALLALAAHPVIVHIFSAQRHQRSIRYLLCIFFTITALSLLAFDVSVEAPAAKVRDRVLRTTAGRVVHDRIQNISHHINRALPFHHPRSENPHVLPLVHPHTPKPPADPPPPASLHQHNKTSNTASRRRLMAIVKDGQLDNPENPKAPSEPVQNTNHSIPTPRNDSHIPANASLNNANENPQPANGDTGDTSTIGIPALENSHTNTAPQNSVSRLVALLGVFMACSASITGRAATEMRDRVMADAGDWSAVSVALSSSISLVFSIMLMGTSLVAFLQGDPIFTQFLSNAVPRGVVLSLSWMVVPVLLQVHGKGLLRPTRAQRTAKAGPVPSVALSSSLLDIDSGNTTLLPFYLIVTFTSLLFRIAGVFPGSETVGALTYAAGALLLLSSKMASAPVSPMSRRVISGSSGDLSANLPKGLASTLRSLWLSFRSSVSASFKGVKDLVVHARSNKASWQVLNFLILQSTMAIVELIYATITNSSGLFSISADNFFCSVALAIGLIAIRISSRKPSHTFSYGYGRIESLCGFANGIILIYVGILVILEAFERSNEDAVIAIGRAFSVCLLGLVGNLLGLYFFPPESRRENHNVQGIYLHIWANTFSFARIALSTAVVTVVPTWKSIDMVSAAIVGLGMVIGAIPLVFRSGRLLLLMPSLEKDRSLMSTKSQLEQIAGVNEVFALRVWNLTPNYLVASVRLKVSRRYEGSDAEILSRARAVFTMIRIPQSQCTIQIIRVDDGRTGSVVYLHKRSRSQVPDTGINVDMLTTSTKSKSEADEEGTTPQLLEY